MSFYAVHKGNTTGIFNSWDECKKSVDGYGGAIYKKFKKKSSAEDFVKCGNGEIITPEKLKIDIEVYTDGACSNNGYENAKAGLGVFFSEDDTRNLSKKVEGRQTNNTAELCAIIEAYNVLEKNVEKGENICIYSDSRIAIGWCTTTGEKYSKKNWKGNIPNVELIKKAYGLFKGKSNVIFSHVKAHTGNTDKHSIGNDGADRLANEAIGLIECPYQKTKKEPNNFPIYYESKEKFICLLFNSDIDIEVITKLMNIHEEGVENVLEQNGLIEIEYE